MSDFNPSPYRGDANIGHVSEELFKMYFVGSNVRSEASLTLSGVSEQTLLLLLMLKVCYCRMRVASAGVCHASGTGVGK